MKKNSWKLFVLFLFVLVSITLLSGTFGPSLAAPADDAYIYLPVIQKPGSIDFTITALEVNQSVQTTGNTVPLVANRQTIVRVFAQTILGDPQGGIIVSLSATRGGSSLGSITIGPQTVPTTANRSDYDSTFNAVLPTDWLTGDINLVAVVDSTDVVGEANEGNNTLSTTLNFNQTAALDIKIVPINYTHQGATDPGYYPGQAEDHISDWIRRAYPVSEITISYRHAYNFTGNLEGSSDWSRLLNEVTNLKSPDGAPASQVYYALVPIKNGSNQWFYSGIAGIGWIGWRVSVGLNLGANDNTGTLAGHEIGHNFGRYHAPCGVSNPDTNYPYANASIGEYGLDISLPSVALLNPAMYKDMMSYCGPEWISDYTYLALYNDLQSFSVVSHPASENMFIRVQFDELGTAVLQPVYTFFSQPSEEPENASHTIELLDQDGRLLAAHPVKAITAEEPGVQAQAIYAQVPVPAANVAAIRLVEGETAVLEHTLSPDKPLMLPNVSVQSTGDDITLIWGGPETPALIRYTADDGQTWTTVGMDVWGGQLTIEKDVLPEGSGRFEIIPANSAAPTVLTAELKVGN